MNNLSLCINIQNKQALINALTLGVTIIPNMDFISNSGKIIPGDRLSFLGRGENSSVWKYEEDGDLYALKIFFSNCYSCSLESETYKIMKELSLKNIVKAIDTFKVINESNVVDLEYDAYLMTYLEKNTNYSIIDIPVSDLLENISSLEDDIYVLSKEKILMDDLKLENTIPNKQDNMIYITDIDLYKKLFVKDSNNSILENNYGLFMELIRNYFVEETFKSYGIRYIDYLNYVFDIDNNILSNPPSKRLKKVLSSYKSPRDFFKDIDKRY